MSNDIQLIDHLEEYEVSNMSSNPLSNQLESLMSFDSFPPIVRRRIKALKKLLFEKLKIEGNFYREVFDLLIKYDPKYEAILDKRRDIINGKHEPDDKECEFALDEDEGLSDDMKQKLKIQEKKPAKDVKGIPGFWLLAMKMDEQINDWVEAHDEPVLLQLVDIRVIRSANPPKLTVKFFFNPNDYFTNKELTKEYEIRFGPDPKNPWDLEDCVCLYRRGCAIDWKQGKNLTKKTRKVKIPSKRNKAPTVQHEVLNSFFDFFTPPKRPEKGDPNSANIEDQLTDDWKLGKLFCDSFVSNAVIYLTGDMFDDDFSSSDSSDSGSASSLGSS